LASPAAYFLIGDYTFEVGGENIGLQQIQGIDKAIIVCHPPMNGWISTIIKWLQNRTSVIINLQF
jgi:hypothetical protein